MARIQKKTLGQYLKNHVVKCSKVKIISVKISFCEKAELLIIGRQSKCVKWHNKWQRAYNEWMVYLLKSYLEGIVVIFHPLNVSLILCRFLIPISEHFCCICVMFYWKGKSSEFSDTEKNIKNKNKKKKSHHYVYIGGFICYSNSR